MYKRVLFATMVAASLVCNMSAQAQVAAPQGDAVNGKRMYMTVGCYLCHGTVGQGGRPSGPHIAPNPLPYEAFAQVVRRPPNAMPPYTAVVLSDHDLGDIYAYLVTIPPLPDPEAAAILNK
jgi:ubiquinol-cytochrome c reductase cytochrome c subunit